MKKKVMATAITFFVTLRCSTAREEEAEGDDNVIVVAFFVALHYNATPQEKEEQTKTNKQEKRKDAYLGPAWVLL
jgi:hypothetical protein